MLATINLKLRVKQGGNLPASHGRFVHAAILGMIDEIAPQIAKKEHDSGIINNFTVSPVKCSGSMVDGGGCQLVIEDECRIRLTALNSSIVSIFAKINNGMELRVGKIQLVVIDVIPEKSVCGIGVIYKDDMIAQVYGKDVAKTVTLQFNSPTVFRVDYRDYPFPLPELIFSSLARKAQQCLDTDISFNMVKEEVKRLIPIQWNGSTKRVYLGSNGGATGFIGEYTFDLRFLDEEMNRLVILLTELAVFTGVGRLTGQGFGQMSVKINR